MVCKQEIGKVKRKENRRNEKVRIKIGNIRGVNKLKLKTLKSQYFFLLEEKSGCLLCSISMLLAPF
jgi:hypothetical protein